MMKSLKLAEALNFGVVHAELRMQNFTRYR